MRKFIERDDFHDRNRWIASSVKFGHAELSDGSPGVMFIIDRNITVMSIEEATRFAENLVEHIAGGRAAAA